jgi:tetratricopeptide (TPR) repeat protein/energy-coupling factor transporter ATP-binding protein EcfA2
MTMINPYKIGPPVKDRNFYDRTILLKQVCDELGYSNTILIQGQRRIGKTSFLHQLNTILTKEKTDGNLLPIFFDIQNCVKMNLSQFQEYLATTLGKELLSSHPTLAKFESDPDLFRREWLPQVFEQLGNKQIVLLVDEFDNLGEKEDCEALETVVPFIESLVRGEERIKWVFTIGRHMDKLPTKFGWIVTRAEKHVMRRLTEEETQQLICEPASGKLTFQPTAVERIYQLTSGHPSLTQALCSEIFQQVVFEEERATATSEDVDVAVTSTLRNHSAAIRSIALVPLKEEQVLRVVVQLAGDEHAASRDDIIQFLNQSHISLELGVLDNALNQLVEWDLLQKDDERWRPTMELVRIWVEENIPLEPTWEWAMRRYEFAEQARREGNYSTAIQDYKEALRYIPEYPKEGRMNALNGLAEAYKGIGDFDGWIDALEELYSLDRSIAVKARLVNAYAEYVQKLGKEGKYWETLEPIAAILKLQDMPRYRGWLVQFCLKEVDKLLQEIKKPKVDKEHFLDLAGRVIQRGLDIVSQDPEAEELRKKQKEIEHEKLIERAREAFEIAQNEKNDKKWIEVVQIYIELQESNVSLPPKDKRNLQEASWKSLYNLESPFSWGPLVKSPLWFKSMVGGLTGLGGMLLLVNLGQDILLWSAPLYAVLVALTVGVVKVLGRQRGKPMLVAHFIAGAAAAGLLWISASIVGVGLFPPSRLLDYVLLIVPVATLLALIVFMEMSFRYGRVRTGIVNSIYTAAGATICALIGGILGIWLVNSDVLELQSAAAVGLGVAWVLVSVIMEIGDPATYSVNADDIQFIFRR